MMQHGIAPVRRAPIRARLTGLNLSTWTVVTSRRTAHHGTSWNAASQRAFRGPKPTLNRAAVISF